MRSTTDNTSVMYTIEWPA